MTRKTNIDMLISIFFKLIIAGMFGYLAGAYASGSFYAPSTVCYIFGAFAGALGVRAAEFLSDIISLTSYKEDRTISTQKIDENS
jgi:hypothetical protein